MKSAPLIVLSTLCVYAALALGLPAWNYASADEIERTGLDTTRLLATYERTGDAVPLRKWFTAYHGEAPGHQVMMSLGVWSCNNLRRFLALSEGFTFQERETFYERFGWALADSGQENTFRQTFQDYRSETLSGILRHIPDAVPWPRP